MSAASHEGHGAGKRLPNNALNRGIWHCDDCMDNRAMCFCCKVKGQILVFPKKGKPKAAGGTTTGASAELVNFSSAIAGNQVPQGNEENEEDEEGLPIMGMEPVEGEELGQDDDMLQDEDLEDEEDSKVIDEEDEAVVDPLNPEQVEADH